MDINGTSMKTLEEIFIKEQDFSKEMRCRVLPFLKDKIKEGYFTTRDGLSLHYQMLIAPEEKGAIVISHGYCEFCTKYAETMYYFYQMGYSTFIVDHRGHGLSDRQVDGYSKVHVEHFEDYVFDFDEFVKKIVKENAVSGKLYLFAHSMGGAIGTLYLEKYPDVFEKAVLSSPMIELSTGDTSKALLRLVTGVSYLHIFRKRYLPGYKDYDHTFKYPRCSALSKARYTYTYEQREGNKHYRSSGGTFNWAREAFNVSKKILKNASLIKIPVIIMQAERDTLVVPEAQNEFARLAANCKVIRYMGSKHEIFNATDEIILKFYQDVFDFLEDDR